MDPAPAPPRSEITEPVPRVLVRALRRAVLDHAATERRRVFAPVLHVGVPGGPAAVLVLSDQCLDHALRVDALEAMVRRTRRGGSDRVEHATLVWLTRSGTLDTRDVDLAWLSAARTAAAELRLALPMAVVNRRSWRAPATGVEREWTRMRLPANYASNHRSDW